MRRDIELIRSILFYIESVPSDRPYKALSTGFIEEFSAFSEAELMEHLHLAIQENLIEGSVTFGTDGYHLFEISRLTSRGHDYLDVIRNDSIWNRVKDKAQKAGGMTITSTWKLAEEFVKRELGL